MEIINSQDKCLVCFEEREKWEDGTEVQLIKHHVSYFPEKIAYVHFKCHQKIHDPDHPLIQFIQYTKEDSIQFYEKKKREEHD